MMWHHQGVPYARHLTADAADYEVVGEVEGPQEIVEKVLSLNSSPETIAIVTHRGRASALTERKECLSYK
jgi:hypothetical protein